MQENRERWENDGQEPDEPVEDITGGFVGNGSGRRLREVPFVTVLILAVNILVFFYLSLHGSTRDSYYMIQHGTMVPALVIENGEYARILTAFFLHFGFSHLFHNMLLLGYLGVRLEKNLGHIRFALIYLLTGIIGNVFSLIYYMSAEPYANCAGASGAVFGIVGAMLWLVIRHWGRLEGITTRQLLLMTLFTLYNGVTDSGVNNVAHVAGLLAGFLLCILLTGGKGGDSKSSSRRNFSNGDF